MDTGASIRGSEQTRATEKQGQTAAIVQVPLEVVFHHDCDTQYELYENCRASLSTIRTSSDIVGKGGENRRFQNRARSPTFSKRREPPCSHSSLHQHIIASRRINLNLPAETRAKRQCARIHIPCRERRSTFATRAATRVLRLFVVLSYATHPSPTFSPTPVDFCPLLSVTAATYSHLVSCR